jgi:hypothetical protein
MHSEDKLFTAPIQNEKVQIKGDAEIEGPVAYGSEGKTYCQRFNVEKTIPNSLDWK